MVLPEMSERQLRGSCLCGFTTYEVRDAFEYSLICHCSQCRRATGAGSKPFAGIAADLMRLHEPDRAMRHGDGMAYDAQCPRSGSILCLSAGSAAPIGRLLHDGFPDPSRALACKLARRPCAAPGHAHPHLGFRNLDPAPGICFRIAIADNRYPLIGTML